MPHLILEYSQNKHIAAQEANLVETGHQVMIESGLFNTPDIKTRSYVTYDYCVGEKGSEGSFLHARVYLLEGRTTEQKQALSVALRDALGKAMDPINQLSIDIRDMTRETYNKQVLA